MPRYGKIARCPRHIREELNRRLDNNEPGARLAAWLNSLPDVQQVLESDFGGHDISEQNLTEWKEHGYRRWQAQQHAIVTSREVTANVSELSAQSGGAINESIAAILATRFADALLASGGEITDEMRDQIRDQVKLLRSISREITRLGRYQHDRDRVHIQRERLGIARERLQLQHSKHENRKDASSPRPLVAAKSYEGGSTPDPQGLTEEEKARRLKEVVFPRRLFPEKYQDEQARQNISQPTQIAENRPNDPKTGEKLDASNKNQTITS